MNPELAASLHPPRLPFAFVSLQPGDFLAFFGIGLLLAVLLLTVFAPLLRKRKRAPGAQAQIAAAAKLPPQERLFRLALILHERGGRLPEDQRHALYTGEPGVPERIEALILQSKRGRP